VCERAVYVQLIRDQTATFIADHTTCIIHSSSSSAAAAVLVPIAIAHHDVSAVFAFYGLVTVGLHYRIQYAHSADISVGLALCVGVWVSILLASLLTML
jgi:hypothetical protein